MIKGLGTAGDAVNVYKSNTLAGGNAFSEYVDEVDKKCLLQYQFPNRKLLDAAGIKAIYLLYYFREWSNKHNADFPSLMV